MCTPAAHPGFGLMRRARTDPFSSLASLRIGQGAPPMNWGWVWGVLGAVHVLRTSAMSLRLPRSQRVEARRLPAALPTPFARSRAVGMPLVPPRTRTRDQLLPSDLPPPPFFFQHHRRWCYNCCSRTAFDLSHVVKNMLLLVLRQLFGGRLAVTTQGRPILGLLSR